MQMKMQKLLGVDYHEYEYNPIFPNATQTRFLITIKATAFPCSVTQPEAFYRSLTT